MTPISATASLPPTAPGLGASRGARPDAPAAEPAETRTFWDRIWGKEGFSFGALLDIVNPLQHIPIVSTIYRAATGDTIGPAPRMMGGALFGGVVGLIAATADTAVEEITGKDTGANILAMLPEPDAAAESDSQWAWGDNPRHQGLMLTVLNVPDEAPTQFAGDSAQNAAGAERIAAPAKAAAAEAAMAESAEAAMTKSAEAAMTKSAEAARMPAAASAATIPTAAQPAAPLFAVPPHTAQLGAGGRLVPLANHGRPGTPLPSPRELAANPALLQEMRQGGANAAPKHTGRLDTAIKGNGLVLPNPEPNLAKGETQKIQPAAPRAAAAIPEVSPDFLMKMQQALDKYQALRAAPTVDMSH
jgi:hypothetical protein